MGRAYEVRKNAMAKTSAVKSKLYSRYGREIYVAAKSGSLDPESNAGLKRIIDKAKKDQVPADIIKRAIDKAKGGSEENYTAVSYEGFGPGNTLFIVECLTDNVNRTVAEVRNCFTKTDGKLGVSGSVIHQFEHLAVFSFTGMTEDEALEILIDAECDISDIELEDDLLSIYAPTTMYYQIKTALLEANPGLDFEVDEITYLPLTHVAVPEDAKADFEKINAMLDDLDDVQQVHHNAKFDE